jgi:hypothetical protein
MAGVPGPNAQLSSDCGNGCTRRAHLVPPIVRDDQARPDSLKANDQRATTEEVAFLGEPRPTTLRGTFFDL